MYIGVHKILYSKYMYDYSTRIHTYNVLIFQMAFWRSLMWRDISLYKRLSSSGAECDHPFLINTSFNAK